VTPVSPLRLLVGAIGLVVLVALMIHARDDLWSPIDRPAGPLPPGDGPLRITAFGTSLTARSPWPDALAARLAACLGRPVTIERVAQPGAGSDWGLAQVETVIATRPDLILMEFAINDADIGNGLWLRDSIATHESILTRLAAALPGTRVVLMTMNPSVGWRAAYRPRLPAYYETYAALADRHGAGLIDLYAIWRRLPDLRAAIPDGLHPSEAAALDLIPPAVAAALGGAACG
jgi:lysophospholipase L1-like esterase